MTEYQARIIFDEKMAMVKRVTGHDPWTDLMMQAGPDAADQIYRKLFACFYVGVSEGIKYACEKI